MEPTEHQPATRNKERTRRAILDAAERLLSERGNTASIAEIAAAAKVSKSGLLHHFPTRDTMTLALVEDLTQRLWRAVTEHIDLSENRPGKFLRGYIRALTGDSAVAMRSFTPSSLWTALGRSDAVNDVLHRDAAAWRAAFTADGIAPGRCNAVRYAAEAVAAAHGSPYVTADELAITRAYLLAATESPNESAE